MKYHIFLFIIFNLFTPSRVLAKGDSRILLNVGVGIGTGENSDELDNNGFSWVEGDFELQAHLGFDIRLLGGLYLMVEGVASWQNGKQQYSFIESNGTTTSTTGVDADIQKRIYLFGGKYRFNNGGSFCPFIAGGLVKGDFELRHSNAKLVSKINQQVNSANPDKGDLEGQFAEVGFDLVAGAIGFRAKVMVYRHEVTGLPSIGNNKITMEGISSSLGLVFSLF